MNIKAVNPLSLPSLPLLKRRSLPECAAVYFVLERERVLYIGRANNLLKRWTDHHRWKQLTQMHDIRIAWLEYNDLSVLPKVERALTKHFTPLLNRTPIPFIPSSPKSSTLAVTISQEEEERLRRLAVAEKLSVGQLATIAIQEYLDRVEPQITSTKKKRYRMTQDITQLQPTSGSGSLFPETDGLLNRLTEQQCRTEAAVESLANAVTRFIQNSEADRVRWRQTQVEIHQIREYLLRRSGNGRREA